MAQSSKQPQPPKLQKTADGDININSLADVLEWFLNYDSRVAIMRHPHIQEIFEWKQADDAAHDIEIYPFENAEARFAVSLFSAIAENDSEAKLALWMTDVLQALGDAKQTVEDFANQYKLEIKQGASFVAESEKLPSKIERRVFLTSAWIESLTTAEVRFLGWIYQKLYDKQFQPVTQN